MRNSKNVAQTQLHQFHEKFNKGNVSREKILLKLRKMRVKLEKSMLEMSTMRRQHKIFKGVRSSCLCVQKCEARVA